MFISELDPRRRMVLDARQYQYYSSPETAFRFPVAKPRMVLDTYRVDRYLIYNQDPTFESRMNQMNHVPRAVSATDQSLPVSLQPSTTTSRPSSLVEDPPFNYFTSMHSSNSTSRSDSFASGLRPSNQSCSNATTTSAGDSSIGQYGVYDGLAHGLYFDTHDANSGHFDLSDGGCAMPSYFSNYSPSTCPINGSSPNTMFGSFSSSIGPPDGMDVDMSEFIHGPPSILGGTASGLYPSGQRENVLTNQPARMFTTSPNPGTTQPETVSPSMLRLNNNPSLPAITSSSSESLPGSYIPFHMDPTSSEAQGTITNVSEDLILPSSEQQSRRRPSSKKTQRGNNSGSKWGRKALPDKAPTPQFILPNNGPKRRSEPDSAISLKQHSKRSKPKSRISSQLQLHGYASDFPSSSHAGTGSLSVQSSSTATDAAKDPPSSVERSAQDEFLVNSRLSGMKYSEIRKLGNFKEAESTLRGRFRTLVKPKEARVRNPQWQEIDVSKFRAVSPFPISNHPCHIQPFSPVCLSNYTCPTTLSMSAWR